jgi:hypothetical protein
MQYQLGDEVSYAINCDRYYAGRIEKMSERFITTDRGYRFTRIGDGYRMTGNRYCWMMAGRHEYLDPHF